MASRADRLRFLLRKTKLLAPPASFTEDVMREVTAVADGTVYANAKLKAALQMNPLPIPSTEFTYKVLNRVREKPLTQREPPIIGRRAWVVIGIFVAICLAVPIVTRQGGDPTPGSNSLLPFAEYFGNLVVRFVEPLFYFATITASACVLLWVEYFLSRGKEQGS